MNFFIIFCLITASVSSATKPVDHQNKFALQKHAYGNLTVHTSQTAAQPPDAFQSKATCGERSTKLSLPILGGRIAGGSVVAANSHPWQAFLVVNLLASAIYCGGTLIDHQWILTSASCVNGARTIDVYLGAHDISQPESQRTKYTAVSFIQHPEWNSNTFENDIAVVKLPYPVNLSSVVNSICLPSPNDPSHEGEDVYLTGWGRTSGSGPGPISPKLKEAVVKVISNAECSQTYSGNTVNDKTICSSGTGGQGICSGDLGGPMAYKKSDGSFVQIGIASFYYFGGCEVGKPSGFTRLRDFVTWIYENTGVMPNSAVTIEKSSFYILTLIVFTHVYVLQRFVVS